MAYDNATYITRTGAAMGEVGGAATTNYGKFVAFTGALAFSAQLTVTTAGTATAHGFVVSKVSGTNTTALATATVGTNVAGTTFNVALSTTSGGISMLQGDVLVAASLSDATGKVALAYEWNVQPESTVTA
jgi:hypothetical protein